MFFLDIILASEENTWTGYEVFSKCYGQTKYEKKCENILIQLS